MDIGLWRSYYGYGKPKITKLYDDKGYLLMRIEYFDNGQVQYYQNVKSPMFGNKERNISMDRHGEVVKIYVEDSVLVLQKGQETEKIGENIFLEKHH
ncbi:MAG TPA: hypothetical protein VG603_16770, partial [Chitinophagales bacterium]|nr:hypothetical protein [Chitinophagales bacterium]